MSSPTSPPTTPQIPACHHGQPRSTTANTIVSSGASIRAPAEYADAGAVTSTIAATARPESHGSPDTAAPRAAAAPPTSVTTAATRVGITVP